jgi:pre-mRNA-splicing factor CWC26
LVEGEDAPAVVAETDDSGQRSQPVAQPPQRKAGLQTAQETARLEAEAAAAAAITSAKAQSARSSRRQANVEAEETVYRDATGRRIDVSMKRAEVRAAELERLKRERREREEATGDVQRREKVERKQAVEDARFMGVARYEDDEGLNEEMKGVGRWGDPMLGYVSEKRKGAENGDGRGRDGDDDDEDALSGGGGGTTTTTPITAKRRKDYQGAAAPNRYGIRPGWRWDGVDRGNGFEKEWFQARGKQSRNANLEYQWQMDE